MGQSRHFEFQRLFSVPSQNRTAPGLLLKPFDDSSDQYRIRVSDINSTRTVHCHRSVHILSGRFPNGESCFLETPLKVDCFTTDGELTLIRKGDDLQWGFFIL